MTILEFDLEHAKYAQQFVEACQPLRGLVARIFIGATHRPGEPAYWIAYAYGADGKRSACSTPTLYGTPAADATLEAQAPELCRQLAQLGDELKPREPRKK